MMPQAYIVLENGDVFCGTARTTGYTNGELVFTTAYTGYEESITDPSYKKQVLTFSYPLIGNYGVRDERKESDTIQPTAVIAREVTNSIVNWFENKQVPVIDRIDTREIVKQVREHGAMQCGIASGPHASIARAKQQLDYCNPMSEYDNIGATVSVDNPITHTPSVDSTNINTDIALIDCGVKQSIIDSLVNRGATVHQLPYNASLDTVKQYNPDIVFISNGPGDPVHYQSAQTLVQKLAGTLPIAGICLGQQIVALALNGDTQKMEFGHRGVNQPVIDLNTNRVIMTTQNHGYTVSNSGELTVTQRNVNDDSAEGFTHPKHDIITRQYHPEAHPGPHDSLGFFDDVIEMAKG